jgi:hypothetical protein
LTDYGRPHRADSRSRKKINYFETKCGRGVICPSVFQQASGCLNCGDSVKRISERIIGLFCKTVKICSSHLDIRPADHQFFVRLRIIGYNPGGFISIQGM